MQIHTHTHKHSNEWKLVNGMSTALKFVHCNFANVFPVWAANQMRAPCGETTPIKQIVVVSHHPIKLSARSAKVRHRICPFYLCTSEHFTNCTGDGTGCGGVATAPVTNIMAMPVAVVLTMSTLGTCTIQWQYNFNICHLNVWVALHSSPMLPVIIEIDRKPNNSQRSTRIHMHVRSIGQVFNIQLFAKK